MTRAFRTCPLCEATCGLALEVDGGRVTRVTGDADDVFSKGYLCPKGALLHHLHDDPDRVTTPLVRRGGALVPATWDEAFEVVRSGLVGIPRDGVALYVGNPAAHNLEALVYGRALGKALRTRSVFSASTVDQMPKHLVCGLLFGSALSIPIPDVDRASYVLMLGANPMESNGSLMTAPDLPGRLKALVERGRLVVVDPRRTRTAELATEHVAIRPGLDAAMLLGIASVLVTEGRARAGEHVSGLAEVADAVRPFTPERVAPACGVDAAVIRRLAHELDAHRGLVYGRMGTCTVRFGTLASWLVEVINVLTGALDREGGTMFPLAPHARRATGASRGGRPWTIGRWRSRVRGLPEVASELPVAALAEEITTPGDGRVRALITVAGNPVLSTPDGATLDAALQQLDLLVCVDPYVNETTRHATVLLPPPSPLCRGHYDIAFLGLAIRNVARWSPPTLPLPSPAAGGKEGMLPEWAILARLAAVAAGMPADERLTDELLIATMVRDDVTAGPLAGRDPAEIITMLSGRTGPERVLDLLVRGGPYGDMFTGGDGLTFERLAAATHGIDLGPLKPRLPEVLATPSGTVELWHDLFAGELAALEAALHETPPDIVLVGRRDLRSNNSWMHNVGKLVSGPPRCTLHVHPIDAARLGLGDRARVTSRVGSVLVPVEVTDAIRPGVVSLPHGWGHDLPGVKLRIAREHPGVNVNLLTDPAVLDVSGNAVLNGVPVDVAPA